MRKLQNSFWEVQKSRIWKKDNKENKSRKRLYSEVAEQAADEGIKEATVIQHVLKLPDDTSFQVIVILLHAHLINLGKPYSYAVEK